VKAAGHPEDHEDEQDQSGGRPPGISVAGVGPAAAAKRQHEKYDENDHQHDANRMHFPGQGRPRKIWRPSCGDPVVAGQDATAARDFSRFGNVGEKPAA
jgi:hypothetical protein